MGRVIHFEICTDEVDSLARFYSDCFGWTVTQKQDGYCLVHTGSQSEKGIHGGMTQSKGPKKGFIPTIEVENLKEALKTLEKSGGKVAEKMKALPGTGYLAYCTDPKGNWLILLEYDSAAK